MTFEVAVIGSGFGGLCLGVFLARAGIPFTIYEKGDTVGGTWRENSYPGAACDIASHLYSFSFEPRWSWSRTYAEQPEILAYLQHCAEKYGLMSKIRFRTEIASATFDEALGRWRLATTNGERVLADAVVTATGQLSRPSTPRIEDIERFRGPVFHSARWDHAVDLRGKRVGVVGTGASAIQFVPRVAREAAHVTVFQRSPAWVLPKFDRPYSRSDRWLLDHVPGLHAASRLRFYLWGESRLLAFEEGGRYNALVRWVATRHMDAARLPAEKRVRLQPDYPPGCKRLLISNDWFETLAGEDVTVCDEPIERASEQGLTTRGGLHDLDVIVYGTGFESTRFLAPMAVRGTGGRDLEQVWKQGAEAYLGVALHGFPNMFFLYGPNTNLVHNSIVFMLEAQARYVVACLKRLRSRRARTIQPTEAAMRAFTTEMATRFSGSIWDSCSSWYRNESGKHTNNWPGFTLEYWWRTRRPRWSDFVLE